MSRPAKSQSQRRRSPTALEGTDEILQVMYWLRGENIAQEVAPTELSKWIGLAPRRVDALLRHLLGSGLVERVVVDSGREEGTPRFRLTRAGVEEGRRRFAEEFSEFTKPRHFDHSDPNCDCEDVSRFSISLKRSLFRQLDEMIREKGYETLADRLIGAKGVKHGKLAITAPQENLGG
jgi:DNA-binding transcriptional ArsR family regulator